MARMSHPDSSQVIEVSPALVDVYKAAGWVMKAARKKPVPKQQTPSTASDATKDKD